MTPFLIQRAASFRIDALYRYSLGRWGKETADEYIKGLFLTFEGIASRCTVSRPIPAEFGVDGFFYRYRNHFVYWKHLSNGRVGIVTILHERMHQIERFKEDYQ